MTGTSISSSRGQVINGLRYFDIELFTRGVRASDGKVLTQKLVDKLPAAPARDTAVAEEEVRPESYYALDDTLSGGA